MGGRREGVGSRRGRIGLTISDNAAADALIDLVGLASVDAFTRRLGLTKTHLHATLRDTIDSISRDAGFDDYAGRQQFWASDPDPDQTSTVNRGVTASAALDSHRGSYTTAEEMARLLTSVWSDNASTPAVCARVRTLMGQRLTRHRIASGFGPTVDVAAESGGLMGRVRNEIGVVTGRDQRCHRIRRRDSRRPAAERAAGRLVRGLVKIINGLAEFNDETLGELLERIVLHSFDPVPGDEGESCASPHSKRQLQAVGELKRVYSLDHDVHAARDFSPGHLRRLGLRRTAAPPLRQAQAS